MMQLQFYLENVDLVNGPMIKSVYFCVDYILEFHNYLRIIVWSKRRIMENKNRSSNIELLRIIAMLMIISYHIIIHCVNVQLTNTTSIEQMQNGWFNQPLFFRQLLLLAEMMPLGLVGNAIFILISGYFLVAREIDMLKISKKLLSQLFFAAITLVSASTISIWYTGGEIVNDNLLSYIRIQYFNKMSWFVGYYFIIMLIAFVFLNHFLAKLSQRQYLGFIFTIFAVAQLGWSGGLLDDLAKGLRTVFVGVFLYALGGYISKYDPFKKVRVYVFLLVIALVDVLIGISYYNGVVGRIQSYSYDVNVKGLAETDFIQSIPRFENYSIVVIIIGICIFELFRRIKMPSVKIINWIAQATFMIYLLHDNGFAYSIWEMNDWITLLYNDCFGFIIKLSEWTFMIFVIGLIAYMVYTGLTKAIAKMSWLFIKQE